MNAHILLVCTANVCRSPYAERLLRAQLGGVLPGLVVSSAGTKAALGQSLCTEVSGLLSLKVSNDGAEAHHPRSLTSDLILDNDLVLVASHTHRAVTARLAPSARSRTFTLREAAALAQVVAKDAQRPDPAMLGPLDLPAFVERLNHARGLVQPELDIPDGHGLSPRRHLKALGLVEASVTTIVSALTLDLRFQAR